MCGQATPQKILSGSISGRRIFLRPPEPTPDLLMSPPSESVYIGKTKFLGVPFFWDPKKLLNPHICVVGMTGSGKSYFVKTFITRANAVLGTSALILDWAGEYCEWVLASGGKVLSFGSGGINLLDFRGVAPHERGRQVAESLEMLTDISKFPSQKSLTEEAIEKAYFAAGMQKGRWKKSKKIIAAPTLREVCTILERTAKKTGSQDARGAARRIHNLLLSSGNSFCSGTMRLEEMTSGLVCVDLHTLPSESLRSLAGLTILQFVKEQMRRESSAGGAPRLFIVVDEAWKIASDERSDVVSIVREGRKYGFSLIVASQNPTDVHKSIFSNAGTTLCFRQQSSSDRDFVRQSLSYSDFFEQQSHLLSVGQALVHLAFLQPISCPSTFMLRKIDGEDLLVAYRLRGGGMELEFERGEIVRRLLAFGFSDRQAAEVLSEFERHNYSISACDFALVLERMGQSRASTISLLREMGASEQDILALFSTLEQGMSAADSNEREAHIIIRSQGDAQANQRRRTPQCRKKRARRLSGRKR